MKTVVDEKERLDEFYGYVIVDYADKHELFEPTNLHDKDGYYLTLEDIYNQCKLKYGDDLYMISVWSLETYYSRMFCYGNTGNFWEFYGMLRGCE